MKKFYATLLVALTGYLSASAQCVADFGDSGDPICVSETILFYDLSTGGAPAFTWFWNFGAGAAPATFSGQNPPSVTYSTPGNKTITLTYTSNGGACSDVQTRNITVIAAPAVSFTSNAPQCVGAAVNFTYTGTPSLSFLWDFGAGAVPNSSTAQNPSGIIYSTAGTKTVTVTIDNGFCNQRVSQTITILTTPTASFASTAPKCTGANVDFTNTGTSTGVTWSWNFGSGATPATSTLENPTGVVYSTSGTKSVTLTITNSTTSCTASAAQTININQTPAPAFTSTAPQCTGSSVAFNYTGTTGVNWTYNWDFGTGASPALSSAQNPPNVLYATAGTKTITLTVTNNGTCPQAITQIISINQTPAASFSSTAPKCTGANVDFTNTGTSTGVTWSWNFGSGATPATSTLENPTGVVYSTSGTKSVTLTITNTTTSCTASAMQTININQTPTASFVSSVTSPQCSNLPVNFTNTSSTGGSWMYFWDFGSGAMPKNSSAENPSGILYSSGGSKVITFTISDANCSATTTQTITITAAPVASFTSNAPICTGDSVNFQNTGTSGATYAWTFGSGDAPAASTAQNPMGILYSTAGIKTVKLVTSMGGCMDSSTQTILINQTPSVSFTSTAPQCVGNSVNFTNTGSTAGNWTFSWAFGSGATPAVSTSENLSGIMYSTGGIKNVTLTISDGTCSNTITQTITINALPLADAGKDTAICNNVSVKIGGASVAGNTYSWFPPSTLSNSNIANPVASPIAPSTIYIVTVTNTATGCTNSDSAVVTMLAPLSVLAGTDGEICRYDSVQIGAGLITGQNYIWSPASGLSNSTSPNPMTSPSVTTTYTLTVTGPGCGPIMDEVTVIVRPLPIADAGPNDTITLGSSTQLTATGGIQYTWLPSITLSNISIYNPIANPTITTTYSVTVTDVFGCVNTDSVTIYVIEPNFWLPAAFTPNGDGQNDFLFAHGEGINGFELGVYNRWGELIWSTKDIKVGWDGRRQIGGEELPEGAYVYYVKGTLSNNTVVDASGLVNLIR